MMLSRETTFLFDLDGTLVHSAPDLAVAVNATLADLGKPTHPEKEIINWVGNGARMLLRRALAGNFQGVEDNEEVSVAFPIFMQHYENNLCQYSQLFDGVEETLSMLAAQGRKMACVTNKPERFTLPLLERLNIDSYFQVVVGGDTLPVLKPDPELLIFACHKLGLSDADIIEYACMVGDSANDIRASKAANIKSIALSYGYAQGVNLHQEGANWVLDNMREILDLLEK